MPVNNDLLTDFNGSASSVTTTVQYFKLQEWDSYISVQATGDYVMFLADDTEETSAPAGAFEFTSSQTGTTTTSVKRPAKYLGVAAQSGTLTTVRVAQEPR